MKKFDRAYNHIITTENLLQAWKEFSFNKKKKIDVVLFQAKLMDNIFKLRDDLENMRYVHDSYHSFNISDPKPRHIHKATIRDRVVHRLLYRELYYYFDKKFIFDSYSCREMKGTHRAICRFAKTARKVSKNNTCTVWVLKCDIKKFFATVDHTILKKIILKHIEDRNVFLLLEKAIESFNTKGNFGVGLPLGNLTSQLFANIYMNEFDQFVKKKLKIKQYIRYADDFVILDRDKKKLIDLIPFIENFLCDTLHLSLNQNKMCIKTLASGIDFLGWVHFPYHRVLRTTTKKRMLKRIKDHPTFETISSYLGMLKHGNAYTIRRKMKFDFHHILIQ